MNVTVNIGWKFVVALGAAVGITILATKLDGPSVERVSIHAIDAFRDVGTAKHSRS